MIVSQFLLTFLNRKVFLPHPIRKMEILPILLGLLAFSTVGKARSREATDEEFPFQVSIQSEDRRHLCGGAIITPSWVLSVYDCLFNYKSVVVVHGKADSNNGEVVRSHSVELETGHNPLKRGRLALIKLEKQIVFSKTTSQAKLPTMEAIIRNQTKLSGWNIVNFVNVPPNLHVIDKFNVITENFVTPTEVQISLGVDEFAGFDEENREEFYLTNLGTFVTKKAILIGVLQQKPSGVSPVPIFIKIAEHGQWIKETLGSDAEYIHWVKEIPKNSAMLSGVVSLSLIGFSTLFLRYL